MIERIKKYKKTVVGGFAGLAGMLHLGFLGDIGLALADQAGALFSAFSVSAFTLGDALPAWIPLEVLEAGALFFGSLFVVMRIVKALTAIKDSVDD
jgi:hypothetical protein